MAVSSSCSSSNSNNNKCFLQLPKESMVDGEGGGGGEMSKMRIRAQPGYELEARERASPRSELDSLTDVNVIGAAWKE